MKQMLDRKDLNFWVIIFLHQARERERVLERERQQQLARTADEFNRRLLLRAHGLRPWRQVLADARLSWYAAERADDLRLMRRCLSQWLHLKRSGEVMNRLKAERHHREAVMRRFMERWIKV